MVLGKMVAPLVGAWIEIINDKIVYAKESVAPLVGAWIEIQQSSRWLCNNQCRSSRGSVD